MNLAYKALIWLHKNVKVMFLCDLFFHFHKAGYTLFVFCILQVFRGCFCKTHHEIRNTIYTFRISRKFRVLLMPWENKPQNPLTFRANADSGTKCKKITFSRIWKCCPPNSFLSWGKGPQLFGTKFVKYGGRSNCYQWKSFSRVWINGTV